MDLGQAYATLGVDESTPLDEVRRRFRMRAQMLHPDRHLNQADLRREAERAMAELNRAWETVQMADRSGSRRIPAQEPDEADPQRRLPLVGECDMCGARPATQVTLKQVTGQILFWKQRTLKCEVCRGCGLNLFRELQSATLVTGWWGVLAPLANLVAIKGNLGARTTVLRLAPPGERDPNVSTPFPPGMPAVIPVTHRPAPWFASVGAAVLAGALIAANAQEVPSEPIDPTAAEVCLDADGYELDCDSDEAVWQIDGEVTSEAECRPSQTAFEDGQGLIYCASAQE